VSDAAAAGARALSARAGVQALEITRVLSHLERQDGGLDDSGETERASRQAPSTSATSDRIRIVINVGDREVIAVCAGWFRTPCAAQVPPCRLSFDLSRPGGNAVKCNYVPVPSRNSGAADPPFVRSNRFSPQIHNRRECRRPAEGGTGPGWTRPEWRGVITPWWPLVHHRATPHNPYMV
jgi:hypothetical protein